MDFTNLAMMGYNTAQTARAYLTGYEASEEEQAAMAAKGKKLTYISLGASAVGAIIGVAYASKAGKSKLGFGLLGWLVVGTLTVAIGSVIIAKQTT
jgi:hypothetical protein